MTTVVAPNQFSIGPNGITHIPTGANFTPYPGNPLSGNEYAGQLGNRLANGDDHRPDEVRQMMQELWTRFVKTNPDLFDAK